MSLIKSCASLFLWKYLDTNKVSISNWGNMLMKMSIANWGKVLMKMKVTLANSGNILIKMKMLIAKLGKCHEKNV